MPESLPSAQGPPPSTAPAPDAAATSAWVYSAAEIGVEIRLPAQSWRALSLFPGCRARLRDETTDACILVLTEYEKIEADSTPSSVSLRHAATETLERFFPQHQPAALDPQALGERQALRVKADCGSDGQIVGLLIPQHGWLVKILLCLPPRAQAQASQLTTTVLSAIHMLPEPAAPPETPAGFVPYDVRNGIPVSDWQAASSGDGTQDVAVCHEGSYHGVLKAGDVSKRQASNRLHGQSLVFITPPESGQPRRWLPLEKAAVWYPSLRPASAMREAIKSAVGIAAIVALVVGIPYGIYSASVNVSSSVSLSSAVEAGVLLIGSLVVGVPLGLFCFKPALNMLAKDPMQGLVALLFSVVCLTMPIWVLGFAAATLFGVLWYLIKWILWLILIVMVCAIICGGVGAGVGAIIGRRRQQTAAQTQVLPPKPGAAPVPHVNLWLPTA